MVENVLPVLVIPEMVCEKTEDVSAWFRPVDVAAAPTAVGVGVGNGGGAVVVVVGFGAEEADLRRPEKLDEVPVEEAAA